MSCVPEMDNLHDSHAVKVEAPILDNLPEDVWDLPKRQNEPTVRDTEGCTMHHRP